MFGLTFRYIKSAEKKPKTVLKTSSNYVPKHSLGIDIRGTVLCPRSHYERVPMLSKSIVNSQKLLTNGAPTRPTATVFIR